MSAFICDTYFILSIALENEIGSRCKFSTVITPSMIILNKVLHQFLSKALVL